MHNNWVEFERIYDVRMVLMCRYADVREFIAHSSWPEGCAIATSFVEASAVELSYGARSVQMCRCFMTMEWL